MTQIAIQTQIEAIKKATQDAIKTKESAIKFLEDAGIIRKEINTPTQAIISTNSKVN